MMGFSFRELLGLFYVFLDVVVSSFKMILRLFLREFSFEVLGVTVVIGVL